MEMQDQNQEIQTINVLRGQIEVFLNPISLRVVNDKSQSIAAASTLKGVKDFQKEIDRQRKELVSPLNARVKAINAYADEIAEPLVIAEGQIKEKIGAYNAKESARIAAENKKIQDEIDAENKRKRAEQEKIEQDLQEKAWANKKKEDDEKAERLRLEAAEKEKAAAFGIDLDFADANARKAEADRIAKQKRDERDRMEREARQKQENAERLAKAREAELVAKQKNLAAQAPKNMRTVWRMIVEQPAMVPLDYWTIDETLIMKAIQSGKAEIPGVRIWSEQIVVTGR